MSQKFLNTLYVTTQGAYLRADHETLVVEINGEKQLQIPGHHLGSIVIFGRILVSPGAFRWCSKKEVPLTHLSTQGKFIGRFIGPTTGNVLLRLDQFRMATDIESTVPIARNFVAGKVKNTRQSILRSARDHYSQEEEEKLRTIAKRLKTVLSRLKRANDLDTIRGLEGETAREYFDIFDDLILKGKETFRFNQRTRYPPRDPTNALLSFLYGLLRHDCCSAVEGVGLDPQIGFLHAARPGRSSLALDLMEEFRPILADRTVLTLINRKQVNSNGFRSRKGGSIKMTGKTLKTVVEAYQKLKEREIIHPLLERKVSYGMLPHIQARLLARTIRGDVEAYPPYIYK